MSLLKDAIPLFTVLSDENRHKILRLLLENGQMNVNTITEHLPLSRPAVSHHLKIMLTAGVISVEQIGKERFYTLTFVQARELLEQIVMEFKVHCPVTC